MLFSGQTHTPDEGTKAGVLADLAVSIGKLANQQIKEEVLAKIVDRAERKIKE